MKNRPHTKNLRKGRISLTGQIYSITTVTRNRDPVFEDFKTARTLINILQTEEKLGRATTLCFVVMPDHLHWLLQLSETIKLSHVIKTIKSLTSKRIGKPIWQKGFYDHAIRQEEDVKNIARYIVANPVRAGLVKNIQNYSHWDAVWL